MMHFLLGSGDRCADDGHEHGFSLIEVLVAFVIVSLGLVSLYSSLGTHFRHSAEADRSQRTLAAAVSHLEIVANSAGLAAGTTTGIYANGTHWQLDVTEIPVTSAPVQLPVRAHAVVLDAFDARGHRLVHLKTVALAQATR